jgi:GT2 family glycosyltransferase/glycosyltransferase involved in cell wall biosynthesis
LTVVSTDEELGDALAAIAGEDGSRPVVVLRPGDAIRPDLVARLQDAFWEAPGLRLVYWDEASSEGGDGIRIRPGWSPDLLTSANYLGRAFALRAGCWASFRPELGDDAWWDVLLSASLDDVGVRRLPRVAMVSPRAHQPVGRSAEEVVGAEMVRRGWPARPGAGAHAVWLEWDLPEWPKVTIVVPSRHNRPLLEVLLPSLARTDYPDFEVVVVDNSAKSGVKSQWYASWAEHFPIEVLWWESDFNYSAVNNAGAALGAGEVLVFLNDDTEVTSAGWLRQLVGWATRPEIGTVGAQLLDPSGLIQHGGVVLGMDGSAGHLFAGGHPGQDSLLGRTEWTRDVLASTAACVALRREVFAACGGFDERFVLCGSDVALGLEAHNRGWRNVVVPAVGMEHMESATRGVDSGVPEDLFASWWRYQRWVTGGDPFFSPSLSLASHWPELRPPGLPAADTVMLESLGRSTGVFRQEMLEATSEAFARAYPVGDVIADAVRTAHAAVVGERPVRTVNWVLPGFDNPYYGGLATIIRIADLLERDEDVEQRFVILDSAHEAFYRSALAAGSPRLASAELVFLDGEGIRNVERIPPGDVAIATMWTTAYVVAAAPGQHRRFYLIQDFEPCFYPAGTMYALAEETYRLGLYGICNTEPIHTMYTGRYGGTGGWFLPAIDRDVFFPPAVPRADPGSPVRVFVYARPGHWRNCWEIARPALEAIKEEFGDRVHLVTAGSWAKPDDLGGGIEHLGLLDVRSTGALYRTCDVGVALTVSEHPSYLPGELMACGVPPVIFDLPESEWIVQHGVTGLRARRTVEGLREQLARIVADAGLRARLASGGLSHVDSHHSDWDTALSGVYRMLCDPEAG